MCSEEHVKLEHPEYKYVKLEDPECKHVKLEHHDTQTRFLVMLLTMKEHMKCPGRTNFTDGNILRGEMIHKKQREDQFYLTKYSPRQKNTLKRQGEPIPHML